MTTATQQKPQVGTFRLANKFGWEATYRIEGDSAKVTRRHKGTTTSVTQMTRAQAQAHYRQLKAIGYQDPENF